MRISCRPAAITCLIGVLASGFASAANPQQNLSLKGIKQIEVLVEDMDDTPESLTKDQVLNDVQLRLRRAGLSVLPASSNNIPYLYIRVGTSRVSPGLFVDKIDVKFTEAMLSAKDPQLGVMYASTWDTGCFGTATSGRAIRDALGDLIDQFLNSYFEANPK